MANINLTINSQSITVPKGTTVYQACKQLGIELPIFCYQDRMPPFGACRVCMVEVEKMGKPQTSCTLEATEGMIVHTDSKLAVDARKGILELLLINHPLDCPICDRGGECPLQDQTVKYGPGLSRFFEEKRHFKKQLPLGPVLMLDRERCIACARCTRFGDVVAGDHALEFKERGYKIEVGTPDNVQAQSKFIGNTIMICPVGALTSQVYRFRARPWDNDSTPTTCTLCPVGCSSIFDSRDGEIMRTRSQENRDVNDIWMCDKGWFGYEFVSHPDRLKTPLIRRNGILKPATFEEALDLIATKMREAKPNKKLAALGGNPLTIEENYLFQKLFRDFGNVNHIDHRVGMPIIPLKEEGIASGMEITIGECENLSSILLLGIDLTEEFPVIWLRIKQAINKGAKAIFIGHFSPEIAQHLSSVITHTPGEEIDLLHRHASQLEELFKNSPGAIFVGRQYLNSSHRQIILSELLKWKGKGQNLSLNLLEGRNNSMGARFAGVHPELGPMGERLAQPGLNATQILETAAENGWDFLHVAGADPAVKYPTSLWNDARSKLNFLVVQDIFLTATAQQADVVLPTLCYAEKQGHFMNIEGRLQPLLPGKELPEEIYSDGEIFALLAQKLGVSATIPSSLISNRVNFTRPAQLPSLSKQQINHNPNSLTATFTHTLFDHGNRMKHNKHLVQMAKEPCVRINPIEGMKREIRNNDWVDLSAHEGSFIKAKVELDERVPTGTIVLPLGFESFPVYQLASNLTNGLSIKIEKTRTHAI